MEEFQVKIKSANGVFYPGQTVEGVLVLSLAEPFKAKAVKIHAIGKAHTSWTESESRTTTNADGTTSTTHDTIYYTADLYYIDHKMEVWRADEDGKIPAGRYEFPFSFILPIQLPPSYESPLGFIRYYCKATIDRPWYKFNDHAITVFGVMPWFDLNSVPHAAQPAVREITKNVGVLMFKHGRVSASVSIPKVGFVPGEAMHVSFAISNTSSRDVKCLQMELIERGTYIAFRHGHRLKDPYESCKYGSRRIRTRSLAKMKEELFVAAHSSAQLTRVLKIPPTVPSFNVCPILQVAYYAKITLATKGTFGNELVEEVPLLIGTVPVRHPMTHGSVSSSSTDELSPPTPSAPPADEPPPSYMNSVFGKGTLVGEKDEKAPEYTPKYVVCGNVQHRRHS